MLFVLPLGLSSESLLLAVLWAAGAFTGVREGDDEEVKSGAANTTPASFLTHNHPPSSICHTFEVNRLTRIASEARLCYKANIYNY